MTFRRLPDLERPLVHRGRGPQKDVPPVQLVILDVDILVAILNGAKK